jgi:hypothetical protein
MCNCTDPTVNISEDKRLACAMCGNTPSMKKIGWQYPIGKPLRLLWTNDAERPYWVVGPELSGLVYCGDCLREFMEVDFSRVDQLGVKHGSKISESAKQKSKLSAKCR